jgi:hypothetical protein
MIMIRSSQTVSVGEWPQLRAVLGTKRAPDQSLFDLAVTPNGDLNSPGPTSSRLLTVDIMFDVTNPGLWMAHCHIAEHMQSGMMFSFNVAREPGAAHYNHALKGDHASDRPTKFGRQVNRSRR